MDSISTALTEWLDKIQADNVSLDTSDDDEPGSFDGDSERLIWYFPTEDMYNEYLAVLNSRPEDEVRMVIRRLLIPTGAFGSDHMIFEVYLSSLEKRFDNEDEASFWREWTNSEYVQRVVRYYSGETDNPPWEGITWVLNLLPDHPRSALAAIDAYFLAHMYGITDGMIHALSDAEGVIRARYIGLPDSTGDRLEVLRGISPREFEQLVEHLYAEKGYQTELTRATADGGRDIIATLSGPGRQEKILVECKHYISTVGVAFARQLLGVVSDERVNKGALVTTANFSGPTIVFAAGNSRIELINGAQLVVLLNEYLGWTWPARIEYYIRNGPSQRVERRTQEG